MVKFQEVKSEVNPPTPPNSFPRALSHAAMRLPITLAKIFRGQASRAATGHASAKHADARVYSNHRRSDIVALDLSAGGRVSQLALNLLL